MVYHDRKSYEERRDAILKFLKLLKIGLVAIALTGCYNSAMMRVSGEARDTCQSDSDCHADYFCVKILVPTVPWANAYQMIIMIRGPIDS